MKRKIAAHLASALILVGVFEMSQAFGGGQSPHESVLDIVSLLKDRRKSSPTEIADFFGVHLHRSGKSDVRTDLLESVGTPRNSAIKSVMISIDRTGRPGRMIILNIDTIASCVKLKDIISRFGQFSNVIVPTPRQPAAAPVRYDYAAPWGTTSFLVSRQAAECLESVRISSVD